MQLLSIILIDVSSRIGDFEKNGCNQFQKVRFHSTFLYLCAVNTSLKMSFVFSNHAIEQMKRRGIKREDVEMTMLHPDQILMEEDNPAIATYQSLTNENGRVFLLRIIVNTAKDPNVIVTLYRTSKVQKYYQ